MNPRHLLAAVERWQENPQREKLLCREPAHRPLEAKDSGASVVLCCPECNYKTTIPDFVIEARAEELASADIDVNDVA